MKRSFFVTGATGLVGSAFVKFARANGCQVKALCRSRSRVSEQLDVDWIEGDLASLERLPEILWGIDVVVHAAAEIYDPLSIRKVNLEESSRLLDGAVYAGVRRWIQLSSCGIYSTETDVISEDTRESPQGLYEQSKAEFDQRLRYLMRSGALEAVLLRPSIIYGEGMRNQSIRQMIKVIESGFFFFIGHAGASANYVHVDDVVKAIWLSAFNVAAANQTYIVSDWCSMEDMVHALAKGLGVERPNLRLSLSLARLLAAGEKISSHWPLTGSRVNALSSRHRFSSKKIEDELGWGVSVDIQAGMFELVKSR